MKPFLSGRTQVQAASLQPIAGVSVPEALAKAAAHKAEKDGAAGGPTVEAIKQGDKVVRIVVTCSCGERIEIDCLYPGNG